MGKSKDKMKRLMSALLTATFAATTITPVLAGPHAHGGGQAAAAPRAPAPDQARKGARGGKQAEQAVAVPQRVAPQGRAMPARTERQHFTVAPQKIRAIERPARFEDRARVQRKANDNVAPFVEVVRPRRAEHFSERVVQAGGVRSYHSNYVTGKVVQIENNAVVLESPRGERFVVRGWHGGNKHWRDRVLTVPIVYENGIYYAYQPAFADAVPNAYTNYIYPAGYGYVAPYAYAPTYGYVPGYGYSSGYAGANALTSVLATVLGGSKSDSLVNSLLTNFLASYLASSAPGYTANYVPAYGTSYASPVSYIASNASAATYTYPATYSSPLSYTYPMTCVYNDPGDASGGGYDPSCAPMTTANYYTSATAYAPAQVQGVVVAASGSTLMVLGANGLKPIMVNDAPALQGGDAFNGQPSVGRVINAYGFYDGNTFVATALQ